VRVLIAVLLVAEGLSTGVSGVTRIQSIAIYPAVTVALIVVRMFVGVLQFAAGWMLLGRSEPGRLFARVALVASACLLTLELGFDLAPTNVFHTYHWPIVAAYWAYVVIAAALLRSKA
jgi:hypothetical protein